MNLKNINLKSSINISFIEGKFFGLNLINKKLPLIFYRLFFKTNKYLILFCFVLSSFKLNADDTIEKPDKNENPRVFDLYKSKNYKSLVDTYGSSYATLSYKELILLGEAYKNLKNHDRHIKILKLLNSKKPNYYKIHLAIAQASRQKAYDLIYAGEEYKSYSQALTDMIDFYRSAITLNPKNMTAYSELMAIYKDQENIPEGLALAKTMLAEFGEKPRIVLDLCEWTRKYGLVSQTQKACTRAAELSPQNALPHVNIALAIRDSGEQEKYQQEIFKIYKEFPNDEAVIDLIGAIYMENKDYLNAEKTLFKNKDTKIENSRINLAAALYENEKFDLALNYFVSSCPAVNLERKKLLRYFESRLRRLEMAGEESMSFKFQREINNCRALPVVIAEENKIRFSHFSEGIRLPSNAKTNIEGNTLAEKRYNYEQTRKKGTIYNPSNEAPVKIPAQ